MTRVCLYVRSFHNQHDNSVYGRTIPEMLLSLLSQTTSSELNSIPTFVLHQFLVPQTAHETVTCRNHRYTILLGLGGGGLWQLLNKPTLIHFTFLRKRKGKLFFFLSVNQRCSNGENLTSRNCVSSDKLLSHEWNSLALATTGVERHRYELTTYLHTQYTFNLPESASRFRMVAIFIIVTLHKIRHTKCVRMFIANVRNKRHSPSCTDSLLIAIKLKVQEIFRTLFSVLFFILEKYYHNNSSTFF